MSHSTNATDKPTAQHAAARCRAAALFIASLFIMTVLAGCGSRPAATVDGIDIKEEDVTAQIEALREQSADSEEGWARYLIQSDMTPEQLREYIIGLKVESILLDKHAGELGVNVTDEDVQKYYDEYRASFTDDEDWQAHLDYMGLTDEAFRASLRDYLIQEGIHDHFQENAQVGDDDVEEAAQYYLSAYGGMKRAEEAVVPIGTAGDAGSIAEAEEIAQGIYKMVAEDGMSLEDAAKAADPDGEIGVIYVGPEWGVLEVRGEGYSDKFADVGAGQVAEPVTGIASVEVFKVLGQLPEAEQNPKLEGLPDEIQEQIRQITRSSAAGTDYQEWYSGICGKSVVRINPAPSPLPYDVDLEKYRDKIEAELAELNSSQG